MKTVFTPGCTLCMYNRNVVDSIFCLLQRKYPEITLCLDCCLDSPEFDSDLIISGCPGCDKQYRAMFPDRQCISAMEAILSVDELSLPDYQGKTMTIQDACPVRNQNSQHDALRELLQRMNVRVTEAQKNREAVKCCGDKYYGYLPVEEVKEKMKERANTLPEEDVVAYCVSCIKALAIGGKTPHHIFDLVFSKETKTGEIDLDMWHGMIDEYRESRSQGKT